MPTGGLTGDESSKASDRDLLAAALTDPPREAGWEVTRSERIEVQDEAGALVAWTSLKGGGIRDARGRLLVTLVPAVKQMFSLPSVIDSAVSGIFGTDAPQWRAGGSPEAPPLNLRYVPASLSFAQVRLQADGTSYVDLLPTGRLNDKLISRAISADAVERIRAQSPLCYQRTPMNVAELSDPGGRVFARTHDASGTSEEDTASNWAIEVLDNDLPGVWLFAILLACRRWHR